MTVVTIVGNDFVRMMPKDLDWGMTLLPPEKDSAREAGWRKWVQRREQGLKSCRFQSRELFGCQAFPEGDCQSHQKSERVRWMIDSRGEAEYLICPYEITFLRHWQCHKIYSLRSDRGHADIYSVITVAGRVGDMIEQGDSGNVPFLINTVNWCVDVAVVCAEVGYLGDVWGTESFGHCESGVVNRSDSPPTIGTFQWRRSWKKGFVGLDTWIGPELTCEGLEMVKVSMIRMKMRIGRTLYIKAIYMEHCTEKLL
jgi:hypothetical protein